MGTGGARAAISRPEAMAATTRTVNPCGLAHPCRSLSEAQTLINSYFRCAFPGCQRSFPTELSLKKHHNLIHPDWISDEGTGNSSTDHMLVLTVALGPLPHLYTLYSDNIESNSESEDNLNIAVLDNKIKQGESDFSKSVSFPLTTRVYVSKMKPTQSQLTWISLHHPQP
jgi:hypothetical protein